MDEKQTRYFLRWFCLTAIGFGGMALGFSFLFGAHLIWFGGAIFGIGISTAIQLMQQSDGLTLTFNVGDDPLFKEAIAFNKSLLAPKKKKKGNHEN